MPFDQIENLRGAIRKCKAGIAWLEQVIYNPPPVPDRFGAPFRRSANSVRELHLRRIEAIDRLAELERTLEHELKRRAPFPQVQSTGSVPQQQAATSTNKRRAKGQERSALRLKRDGVIYGAIQAGLKGVQYCKYLDDSCLSLLPEWRAAGCPDTYTKAYRGGEPWRKKIQDEKTRAKRVYDQTTCGEREKIIQAVTRPTRSKRVNL